MISNRISTTCNTYDVEPVKQNAAGRWVEILSAVCGFSFDLLDGDHHPCPKCGGKDRFRMIDDVDGAVICNQCFNSRNGDGFAAIMWSRECDLNEAVNLVAGHLGMEPPQQKRRGDVKSVAVKRSDASSTPQANPARERRPRKRRAGEFIALTWSDQAAKGWAIEKPGIDWQSIRKIGAEYGKYRDHYYVIALPVYDFRGQLKDDWAVYNTSGVPFVRYDKSGQVVGQVKMKLTTGCQPGVIGTVDRIPAAEIVWSVEGPTDLLALLSIMPDACVISNPFGCSENPAEFTNLLAGKNVVIIRDCDRPGQQGAERWVKSIAKTAASVRNVVLPFPIVPDHGQDLRDWIATKGGTADQLLSLVTEASPAKVEASSGLGREYCDSRRLADGFAATLAAAGRRYVLHCGQWYERLPNRYRPASADDLKGEIRAFVESEFERAANEGEYEGKFLPKVSTVLINETIAALSSKHSIRSDVELNSWINDDGTATKRVMLSMKSCLLDLDLLLSGEARPEDCLQPHSQSWFSTVAFDYDLPWACYDNGLPDWESGRRVTAITELPSIYMEKVEAGEAPEPRPVTEDDVPYLAPTALGILHTNLEDDQERIDLLQEWTGYCYLPDTNYQKFLLMQGEGANGKSVYCAMLQAILGEINCSMIPLEVFGERFQKAGTLGKLVNISSDAGEIDKACEGDLKAFTSGDRVNFERKYLPSIDCVPTARMVICCNTMPSLSDRSDGIWRRMMLVPWQYQVPEDEQIPGLDKAAYWRESGELPGLMAWAIFGAHRLLRRGKFTKPKLSIEAKEEYRTETNSARLFLREKYMKSDSENAWVSTQEVYDSYVSWCEKNGCRHFKKIGFSREVVKYLQIDGTFVRRSADGKCWRAFKGMVEIGDDSMFE